MQNLKSRLIKTSKTEAPRYGMGAGTINNTLFLMALSAMNFFLSPFTGI